MAPKKTTLSLAELGEFDDFLTDAFVDKVYYWTKIRKTKRLYLPNRRIRTEDVVKVIVEDVVRGRSITTAVDRFQQLPAVSAYISNLKDDGCRSEFSKHLRRYLQMYHPEAGFEVGSTIRYTLHTPEACVLARKQYKAGETIKYLNGAMVLMTPEEEENLDDSSDFSVICSSRMKGTSVLLGPARFVNHDCNPNCKFITTNKDNVSLMATREIGIGAEITIMYSEDYFGDNNCECLCQTCEERVQNGFAPTSTISGTQIGPVMTETASSELLNPWGYTVLTRRSASRAASTLTEGPIVMSRTSSTGGVDISAAKAHMPKSDAQVTLLSVEGLPTPPEVMPTPPPSSNDSVASASEDIVIGSGKMKGELIEPEEGLRESPDLGIQTPCSSAVDTPGSVIAEEATTTESQPTTPGDGEDEGSDVELSDIEDDEFRQLEAECAKRIFGPEFEQMKTEMNNLNQGIVSKKRNRGSEDAKSANKPPKRSRRDPVAPYVPQLKRFPGDSANFGREGIECTCTDCGLHFWNPETWWVPRSCRRCERHSKIYGLAWPKTFKRKNDTEAEVLDPRTVMRYIPTKDYKKAMNAKREAMAAQHAGPPRSRSTRRKAGIADEKAEEHIMLKAIFD